MTADDYPELPELSEEDLVGHKSIHIRNVSLRCGRCGLPKTLAGYKPNGDWNVYTFECENDPCDPESSRVFVEVPIGLDEFANRDPNWRGGRRHAGSEG